MAISSELFEQARREHPDWRPTGNREKFLTRPNPEPLSDDPALLRNAIRRHVTPDDTVLTTVLQAPFFQEAGVAAIHAYDISPLQIDRCQPDVSRYARSINLCDVYDKGMIEEALEKTKPNVVFLSNIPEWGTDEDLNVLSRAITAQPSIEKVMFTQVISEELGCRLSHLLAQEDRSIEKQESGPDYGYCFLYVATKPER